MSETKAVQRLVFTGDISFDSAFAGQWETGCLQKEVAAYLRGADHVIGNVECPLTNGNDLNKTYIVHASDPRCGAYLALNNIKIWNLANNHIMDCKESGLFDTIRCAEENGCVPLGVGENLEEAAKPIVLGDAVRVGVISVVTPHWKKACAGTDKPGANNWGDMERIRTAISLLRQTVDWVVVVAHSFLEYSDLPYPQTRKTYHRFLSFGADIVVAHHPHVVQNYEIVGDKAIFYSLGNFIFDTENQRKFVHTDRGVLLGIDFYKNHFSVDHLATRIDRETHQVCADEAPAVFCPLSEKEYRKLFSLERLHHIPVLQINVIRNYKKNDNEPAADQKIMYAVATKTALAVHKTRVFELFKTPKNAKLRKVAAYLKEKDENLKQTI